MNIKRILLIVLLVFVLGLIIVPLAGYQMLKSRDIRAFISGQVEARTGWHLSYSDHELAFFNGIELHDLDVTGPDGFTMTAAQVRLKPSYFRLLTGTLYMKEVTVTHPYIRLGPGNDETEPVTDDQPAGESGKNGKLPVGLVTILDGTVELVRPDQTVQINGIELSLTPDGNFNGSLQPGSSENRLTASGTMNARMQLQRLRAEMELSDIVSLGELAGTALPITQLEADIELTLEPGESGRKWGMVVEATTVKLKPEYPQGNIPLRATLNGTATDELDRLVLTDGQCSVGELVFTGTGTLLPKPDLRLAGQELPVDALARLIPPDVSPFPPSLSLEGLADLQARVSESDMDVQLQFDRVKATPEGLSPLAVTGELSISGADIRIPEIRLKGDWLEATVQGGIAAFMSDHPATELALHINRAAIPPGSSASPAQPTGTDSGVKDPAGSEPVAVTYPDFEGVKHNVRITADRLSMRGVNLLNMDARLKADDRKIRLLVNRVQALDGDVSLKADIEPAENGIRFTASGTGSNVRLGDNLPLRLPLDGGVADFTFKLNGAGNRMDRIRDALNGTIDYSLSETVLRDTPVVRRLSEILNTRLAGERVKAIQSTLSIQDGWVDTGNPVLKTRPLSITANGRFSLGGNLDLKPGVHLTGETTERLPGTLRKLTGSGPVDIPFTVTGTWTNPDVKPDTKGIVKDAADQLKKKLFEKLFQ